MVEDPTGDEESEVTDPNDSSTCSPTVMLHDQREHSRDPMKMVSTMLTVQFEQIKGHTRVWSAIPSPEIRIVVTQVILMFFFSIVLRGE